MLKGAPETYVSNEIIFLKQIAAQFGYHQSREHRMIRPTAWRKCLL